MTIVANFTIKYTQILNAQGELVQALPPFAEDPNKLIELYKLMTQLRVFDTKAIALQRTGKMGTYASTLGQEAVSVALGRAMQAEDVLCPAYREYGAQLQRGVKISDILTYWGGDERGNNFANTSGDFPITVPISTQCLHAVGVASAFKIRKQPRVAVSVCGDGGTSQGDFYEAMNVAGAWNLPAVFIVTNNQWAISIPRKMQTKTETLAQKAIAGGFTGEQVDGNDAIALYHVMKKAIEKARDGGGPTLIEALTYRLSDHTTADDANRYRPKEELTKAWEEEPIKRLRTYLMAKGYWTEQNEEELLQQSAKVVENAVNEYINLTPPSPADMFNYMYATLPHDLLEQRTEAIASAKGD